VAVYQFNGFSSVRVSQANNSTNLRPLYPLSSALLVTVTDAYMARPLSLGAYQTLLHLANAHTVPLVALHARSSDIIL